MGLEMSRYSMDRRVLGIRGLLNFGLSCCVNAVLQSFSATTELLELLKRWQPSGRLEEKLNVPLQLKKALCAMREQLEPAPHRRFLDCLHHYQICWYTAHDADEVFHSILNLIEKQMSDQDLATEIKNLFKIKVEGHILCSECTYTHHVPTYFLSLPLHVREDTNTLEDCIRSFFECQKLEDGELFYCERCGEKTQSSQMFKLVSLPSILCIHLKRFRNSEGYTRKLYCEVSFPKIINIAEVLHKEHPEMPENRYSLYAVIVHSGKAMFGHYTAYVCSLDGKWYYTNDSCVREASWEEVQQTYRGHLGSYTAYMLLYRRASSDIVQTSSE
ncbi:ubl carboxyl-terminal hydrolase 18 [Electrophorus electricus]|uniref:USP domain-containing protein n=1 Tax=Electrophorus electricus TaxID=8005 RepID=A0A4W4HM21_ELEEL|nr:ubl carboxyl-terminal hydrolase 18 [Electrophorus electricus]